MAPRFEAVVRLMSVVAVCSVLRAQSTKIDDLGAGRILVMAREALDPIFAKSVILLIHYGEDGVVGLRLNQRTDVPLSRVRELASSRTDLLYVGGPVEIGAVTGLVRTSTTPPDGLRVAGDLYAVQTKMGLTAALKTSKGPADLRIYLGYCGWTIPQLQNEVVHGGWHIFDHGERFAFDSTPATLWNRLIELTEAKIAFAPSR